MFWYALQSLLLTPEFHNLDEYQSECILQTSRGWWFFVVANFERKNLVIDDRILIPQ